MSGGVDSAVCTALLNAALGPDRVIAVHIDNGFLRRQESVQVKSSLETVGIRPMGKSSDYMQAIDPLGKSSDYNYGGY